MEELFAKRLSELISSNNFTLDKIEEYVGKTNATISRYASGEITGVKRSTIVKLANFFNVSPAWLAGFSDDKYENVHISEDEKFIAEAKQRYGDSFVMLLYNYSKLNDLGKETANQRVEELTEMSKYTETKKQVNKASG